MTDNTVGESKYDELNDAEWLRKEYTAEGRSISDIGEEIGCSPSTVNRHLQRHDIERDQAGRVIKDDRVLDKNWLRQEYVEKRRSAADIADELDYSPKHIRRHLRQHGLEVRSGSDTTWYQELADPEYLERRYVDDGLILKELAQEVGCSVKGVHNALIRHDVITPDGSSPSESPRSAPAPMHTDTRGYEVWTIQDEPTSRSVRVHQLVAIADGVSPSTVFDKDQHCHHRNGIPWDNRSSNIAVLERGEHARLHNEQRWESA